MEVSQEVKVLVIDINPQMRKLWLETLNREGYKIRAVANIDEALKLVRQEFFQIVIIDITSKEKSGFEEVHKFKEVDPKICVIISSGTPSLKSAIQAMRGGAYDYIAMPFDIEEVRLVVRRAMERFYLLKEASQKEYYHELSILDCLTGLHNYRYFNEVISREVARAKRYPQAFALMMIDIDGFKSYNDSRGHLAGDELLKSVSKLFIESIRVVDMVFRYGGEEFTILLPQTSREGAAAAANRIINSVKQKMPITISIGLASFPEDGQTKDELINCADKALYQAKYLGKGRVCVFEKAKMP